MFAFNQRFVRFWMLAGVLGAMAWPGATADAQLVWEEDFSGINGAVEDTPDWTGVENLPSNNSLRNHNILADDDGFFGFDGPLAMGDGQNGLYSGGGALYTTVPTSDFYIFTGQVLDFGQGDDRQGETGITLESVIDTNTNERVSNGWELHLARIDDDGTAANVLRAINPDGATVLELDGGTHQQDVLQAYDFQFVRDGDEVTVTLDALGNQESVTVTDPFTENDHLQLVRRVSGFDSNSTRFGWSNLSIVVPEPSSLLLTGAGLGALMIRRRRGAA